MPASVHFCTSRDGTRLAYASSGSGPLLMRAPHWFTHLEHERTNPACSAWAPLEEHYSVLRFDQRGCGLSDRDVAVSFDNWVADIEAVADAAHAEKFALLGISQGAPMAVAYAANHAERVTHLILYGGYARGWARRGWEPARLAQAETMERLIEVGWDTEDSSFRQVFSTQFMPDADLQTFKAFNEAMRLCTSAANAVRIYRTFGQIDVEALAATLSCPTLVLHPRGDLRAPFDEGRRLASAIPEANFVPLESRNHIMLASEPAWQTCLDEIYRFYPPRTQPKKASAFPTLTPRQRDILELIAQGLDNAQIAARLELSEKTVRNTITQIFDRIEVENRSQAIVRARDAGLGSGG